MMSPEHAPRDLLVCEVFPGKGFDRPPAPPPGQGLFPPRTREEIERGAREDRRWSPEDEAACARRLREEEAEEARLQPTLGGVRALRRVQLAVIHEVTAAYDSGRIYDASHSCMADWALPRGMSNREAYAFLHAGHLFAGVPGTRVRFLLGRLCLDNAALLGELYEEEGGLPRDQDWVEKACRNPTASFREEVEDRREARLQGGPVKKVEVRVTKETAKKFARARELASRKAQRSLSRGEAFDHILEDYLQRHDPLRKKGRPPKRVGHCSLVGPYIPRSESDRCRRRFGDRCAVTGCSNRAFLDFAHIRAREVGGANLWWNLLLMCRAHHRQFDAKQMLLVGPAGGAQWFEDRKGRKVADLRPPPAEYLAAYPPRGGP